jgi:TonB family protein
MAAPAPETARGAPSEPMATPDTASLQGAADDATPTSSVADAASREAAAAVVEPPPAAARLPATPAAAQPDTAARPPESAFGETREVKALRRPPPAYPREAQIRGLSGWVRLRFTVTAAGTTRDARVVAADPPGVFDQAALDAAQRFVYSPRLENGVAVDRENVETEVTFTWIERGGDLITGRRDPVPR